MFHDFFPELAERETRTAAVLPGADLDIPPGEYALWEMFCDEPGCDCRRVLFSVFSSRRKQFDAVVTWGWEDIEFYFRWMRQGSREDAEYLKGPSLNLGSPQSDYAPAIRALVGEILDADPAYAERIKRHYALFRSRIDGEPSADSNTPEVEAVAPEPTPDPRLVWKTKYVYCFFCGSRVGQDSDRTGGIVTALYDCPKCWKNYCSECSYSKDSVQYCLRCDSLLEELAPTYEVVLRAFTYEEPVRRLFELGWPKDSVDYAALGLSQEHVPDLIALATDMVVYKEGEDAESQAPVHAWRALGQLRAEAAIDPLVGLLGLFDEDDEWAHELPGILGAIGAAAIPALTAYLENDSHGPSARIAAAEGLKCVADRHPVTRGVCVEALTAQLEHFADNHEELNAFLISWLTHLNAVESAPAMEQAFAADAVDLSVAGDWEDVQVELGLLEKRVTPPQSGWLSTAVSTAKIPQILGKPHAKARKKRKDQKRSRKKNRRK
jgi:hypothetical protein